MVRDQPGDPRRLPRPGAPARQLARLHGHARRPLAAAWIPAVISIYLGSRWIRTLEEGLGTSGWIRPILAAVLFPLLFLHVIYVQRSVNEIWRRAEAEARPAADWTAVSGAGEAFADATRAQAQREAERWR